MLTPQDVLQFSVVPLIVSAVIIALTWRRAFGGTLAVGAGFIAAFAGIAGWKKVWTVPDATGWLIYGGILLTVIAVVLAIIGSKSWIKIVLQLLAVAAISGLMLKFNINSGTWSPVVGGTIVLAIAAIAVIDTQSVLARASSQPVLTPLAMSMIAGIGGLAVMTLADQSVGEGVAAMGSRYCRWSSKPSLRRSVADQRKPLFSAASWRHHWRAACMPRKCR